MDQIPNLASAAGLASSSGVLSSAQPGQDTPDGIKKVATQFESLLIGEILKSARDADGSGWLGNDEDEAGSSLTEMSEQQIAQTLAASGGFGLAKMISSGLAKASHQVESARKR